MAGREQRVIDLHPVEVVSQLVRLATYPSHQTFVVAVQLAPRDVERQLKVHVSDLRLPLDVRRAARQRRHLGEVVTRGGATVGGGVRLVAETRD